MRVIVQEQIQEASNRVVSEFLSPEGLSELLEVPLRTVYTWNHQGTGPRAIKVGKHVRYRRRDVEKWLEGNTAAFRSA